MFEQSKAHSK